MRKITIFLFLLSLLTSLNAQDRVNKELPKLSEPLSVLDEATGWSVDEDGQWVGGYKEIRSTSLTKRDDNFSKYEFRNLSYKGDTVLVLLKKGVVGGYEYPSIKKNWKTFEVFRLYLLDKKQYLDQLYQCDSSCVITLDVLKVLEDPFKVDRIKAFERISLNYFEKAEDHNDGLNTKISFQFKLYKQKEIARFFIFEEKYLENKIDFISSIGTSFGNSFPDRGTDKIYELYYYETTLKKFDDFIHLRKY